MRACILVLLLLVACDGETEAEGSTGVSGADLGEVEDQVTSLQAEVDAQAATLDAISADLDAVEDDVTDTSISIAVLESELEGLSDLSPRVDAAEAVNTDLESRLSAVEAEAAIQEFYESTALSEQINLDGGEWTRILQLPVPAPGTTYHVYWQISLDGTDVNQYTVRLARVGVEGDDPRDETGYSGYADTPGSEWSSNTYIGRVYEDQTHVELELWVEEDGVLNSAALKVHALLNVPAAD